MLTPLPETGGHVVVRAHHHETHRTKIFSSLVSHPRRAAAGRPRYPLTMTVLSDDACDYLAPGERFVLWRGSDLGSGVVTRRIFV